MTFPAKEQYLSDMGQWDHWSMDTYSASAKGGYELTSGVETGVSASIFHNEGMSNSYDPGCISDYNLAQDKWRVNRRPYFGDEQTSVKDFALRNRAFVWPEAYRVTVIPYLLVESGDFSIWFAPFFLAGRAAQVGYASTDHELTKGYSALFTDRKDPNAYDPFYDIKDYGGYGVRIIPSYRVDGHTFSLGVHWRRDTFSELGQALSAEESPRIAELGISGCTRN